jgi:hypothetical protein
VTAEKRVTPAAAGVGGGFSYHTGELTPATSKYNEARTRTGISRASAFTNSSTVAASRPIVAGKARGMAVYVVFSMGIIRWKLLGVEFGFSVTLRLKN